MSRTTLLRGACCALLAALILAGCGSGDTSTEQSTAATATPTATATVAATPDTAADKRIAREALLTLDDFPSGWTQTNRGSSDVQCDAVKDARAATSARVNSPTFNHGKNTQVGNSIYLFAEEPAAQQAFDALASKTTRLCFARTISDTIAEQADIEVGDTKGARLSIDPLGDQREAARLTIPVSAEGVDIDLVLDLVFVRAVRGVSLSLYVDAVSAFDEDLRTELTSESVRRLSAAVS